MDFLNKNQKVYIGEEEKKVFLEKLKRDVEVMTGVLWEITASFSSPQGGCLSHSQSVLKSNVLSIVPQSQALLFTV